MCVLMTRHMLALSGDVLNEASVSIHALQFVRTQPYRTVYFGAVTRDYSEH